jgi:hypothetical protein
MARKAWLALLEQKVSRAYKGRSAPKVQWARKATKDYLAPQAQPDYAP